MDRHTTCQPTVELAGGDCDPQPTKVPLLVGRNSTVPIAFSFILSLCAAFAAIQPAAAQDIEVPVYLRDRGTGIRTSLFASYVRESEFLFYPFYEYYHDNGSEGRYRAHEGLIFMSYGLTDWLAVEFEAAIIDATLDSPDEGRIHESGLGDVEAQLRARLVRENSVRPEIFSYFEAVFPTQKDKELIGTADWEFKLGAGLTKGFSWGTLTLRGGVEYSMEESKYQLGEVALEYLKRLSPAWRVGIGVEGNRDDAELITEVQWHINERMYLKFNNAFGIRGEATDWAPEVGFMFSF